jgi:hypothetical protein
MMFKIEDFLSTLAIYNAGAAVRQGRRRVLATTYPDLSISLAGVLIVLFLVC